MAESIRATAIETAVAEVRSFGVPLPITVGTAVVDAILPAVVAQVQADDAETAAFVALSMTEQFEKLRADAWDEGYARAGHELFDGVYDGDPETSANPYREKSENSHDQ